MKKFKFSMLAMAGLLFASCADNEVVEGGGQGEARSEGYMALSINLPTTPSTRAANDDFDDGDEDEYAVNNCALLIYQGTKEDDADFLSLAQFNSQDLNNKVEGGKTDNITTSYLLTTTVSGVDASKKLYALALLNYDGILTIGTTPTIGNTQLSKLSEFRNVTLSTPDLTGNKKSFFMANAVLSTTPGGSSTTKPSEADGYEVFQYAVLDPRKIYDDETKAKADPAGEILVERAVAKATMSVTLSATGGVVNSSNCKIENIKWAIDNTEPSTYVLRNPGTYSTYIDYSSDYFKEQPNYRFVGSASTLNSNKYGTSKNYYRTYWCIDPQYDKPTTGMISKIDGSLTFSTLKNSTNDNPQYCYENTFNVENQSYRNTTRAVIQVKLNDDATFYTINGGSVQYKELKDAVSYVLEYIMSRNEVVEAFKNNMNNGDETLTLTTDYFNVTTEDDENSASAGQVKITGITLSEKVEMGDDKPFKEALSSALSTALGSGSEGVLADANKNLVILKYVGGVMYYEARFQHFAGNPDLAPWNTWEETKPTSGNSTTNAYPGNNAEQNYLGRYGMVRNNWYDVTVTAFNSYGYPTVPSVDINNPSPGYDDPDTPDDNLKDHIAVKIHVLAWAKRTQSWGF